MPCSSSRQGRDEPRLVNGIVLCPLFNWMQTGKNIGMQTLDDAIQDLLTKKWISPEEAYEKSIDKNRFAILFETPLNIL